MAHALLADALLVLHALFIAFAVAGGWLALRWPWVPWVQLPCAAWAVWVEASGDPCPLTAWENRLRAAAGQRGYAGGYIEHHLGALIYPEGLTREVQALLALGVLAINVAAYGVLLARRRRRAA